MNNILAAFFLSCFIFILIIALWKPITGRSIWGDGEAKAESPPWETQALNAVPFPFRKPGLMEAGIEAEMAATTIDDPDYVVEYMLGTYSLRIGPKNSNLRILVGLLPPLMWADKAREVKQLWFEKGCDPFGATRRGPLGLMTGEDVICDGDNHCTFSKKLLTPEEQIEKAKKEHSKGRGGWFILAASDDSRSWLGGYDLKGVQSLSPIYQNHIDIKAPWRFAVIYYGGAWEERKFATKEGAEAFRAAMDENLQKMLKTEKEMEERGVQGVTAHGANDPKPWELSVANGDYGNIATLSPGDGRHGVRIVGEAAAKEDCRTKDGITSCDETPLKEGEPDTEDLSQGRGITMQNINKRVPYPAQNINKRVPYPAHGR